MGDFENEDGEGLAPEEDLTQTRILAAPKTRFTAGHWPLKAEVLGGAMDGLRSATERETLTIGRSEENDLVLTLDAAVSACHARLHREGGRFWLEDLDSRNGTFLGTQRVEGRVPIGRGTIFTVGHTRLEFMVG